MAIVIDMQELHITQSAFDEVRAVINYKETEEKYKQYAARGDIFQFPLFGENVAARVREFRWLGSCAIVTIERVRL